MDTHKEIKRFLKLVAKEYDLIPIRIWQGDCWQSVDLSDATPQQVKGWIIMQLKEET